MFDCMQHYGNNYNISQGQQKTCRIRSRNNATIPSIGERLQQVLAANADEACIQSVFISRMPCANLTEYMYKGSLFLTEPIYRTE